MDEKSIGKGIISIKDSINYKSLHDELISEKEWKKR